MHETTINGSRRSSYAPRPTVDRYEIDWEISDFSDLVLRRSGHAFTQARCLFMNPLYTVKSPAPTPAFYRKSIWARDRWILILRDAIKSRGLHSLNRQLTTSQRQLQISGVMIIEGTTVPPHVWVVDAAVAMNPDLGQIIDVPRPVEPALFESHKGRQSLAIVSREELLRLLMAQSSAALYVTPGSTLSSPVPSTTFLREARKAESQWHRRLTHYLGPRWRSMAKSADLATRMLVFRGTLVVEGQFYVPGGWPDEDALGFGLKSSPCETRTVLPNDLGLDILTPASPISQGADRDTMLDEMFREMHGLG